MFFNINNYCSFEGRMVKDPELTYLKGGGLAKVTFTIAVNRNLTANQRQDANAQKADFIKFEMLGKRAESLCTYFQKGSGIRVVAAYKTSSVIKDGVTNYYSIFEVVDYGFCLNSPKVENGNVASNNNNLGANNYNNRFNGNNFGGNNFGANGYNNGFAGAPLNDAGLEEVSPIDYNDMPF